MAQKNGRAAHISNFNHNDDDVKLRGPGFGVPDESSREPGADYQETSSEEEDSDEEFNEAYGGLMMWDDDEQYLPQPVPENEAPQLDRPEVAEIFKDEHRNSLVFSTEDLKRDYHMLKYVSKDWSN